MMKKRNKYQVSGTRYQKSGIRYQVSSIRSRFFFLFVNTSISCFLSFILILMSCVFLSSCGDDDDNTIAPKPRAYFRLSFPEKKYVEYDSTCPFKFEIPVYSKLEKNNYKDAEPCWLDLNFPALQATIHLTYKDVQGNLKDYLENTYTYVSKHQVKSSGITTEVINKDSVKVYGLIYDIGGNAASSIQFFLTDSTKHFIRGALYFNAVPNTDSIKPAVDFIKKDIYRMIETFEWKDSPVQNSGSGSKAMNKK
jgi:gliding motility-associated lipoprotein GldD